MSTYPILPPQGSLKQFLLSHRNSLGRYQEEGMLVRMSVDMASGLDCLHCHKFFHRSDLLVFYDKRFYKIVAASEVVIITTL